MFSSSQIPRLGRIVIRRHSPGKPARRKIRDSSVAILILIIGRYPILFHTCRMPMNTNPAAGQATFEGILAHERGAIANKWGSALDAGFQVVPSVLVKAQSRLGLDAVDCMILLNLNLRWWQRDRLPYPPPALIAQRMGVSRRTVE